MHVIIVLASCADASILPSFHDDIDMATEGEEVSLCVEVASEGLLECSVQVFILSNPGRQTTQQPRIPKTTPIRGGWNLRNKYWGQHPIIIFTLKPALYYSRRAQNDGLLTRLGI